MTRLSLAQTVPAELLTRIFGWLVASPPHGDDGGPPFSGCLVTWPSSSRSLGLCSAALVCRNWAGLAQRALMCSIDFSTINKKALAATLQARPDLARAVRAVDLGVEPCPELATAWSALATCSGIRHVLMSGIPRQDYHRIVNLLHSLELETLLAARNLDHDCAFLSPDDLVVLSRKPSMRCLDIMGDPEGQPGDVPRDGQSGGDSFLSSASFDLCHLPMSWACPLLRAASSTLRRVVLAHWQPLTFEGIGVVLLSLEQLEELAVDVEHWSDLPIDPWFDDVLPRLKTLVRLSVSSGFARPSIIRSAPPTLKDLIYECNEISLAPSLEAFTSLLSTENKPLPVNKFRVAAYFAEERLTTSHPVQEAVKALGDVCAARSMDFSLALDSSLHDIPQIRHISFF